MPTALLGKNAFIQFLDDDEYVLFGCATDLAFRLHTATVNVATIGSGYWDDFEGDSNSYTIDLSGLTIFNEPGYYSSFDLIEVQKQMVAIQFKIIFEDASNAELTNIYGSALITEGGLQAGVEFVNSGFTLVGKGEPIIGLQPTCSTQITSFSFDFAGVYSLKRATVNSIIGEASSYDYRVDGGAIDTSFDNTWLVNMASYPNAGVGAHVIEVWPVCGNGVRGVKLTHNFTISI